MAKVRDELIESLFPNIGINYTITSPQTHNYNCIAFAAGDETKFWWPIYHYWPEGVPEKEDLQSFIECYKSLGYEECGMNSAFEEEFEKIALYTSPSGKATHASKQVSGNIWKSKLGTYYDIEHEFGGLNGWITEQSYGTVACIMKRKLKK